MGDHDQLWADLGPYEPMAVYYEDADSLEYIVKDVPSVHRRVDELLTLILAMNGREPIGFRIKGFRNFYLRHLRSKYDFSEGDFLALIDVVREAVQYIGDGLFEKERKDAYQKAMHLAQEDHRGLRDFPKVA